MAAQIAQTPKTSDRFSISSAFPAVINENEKVNVVFPPVCMGHSQQHLA
jgi:hypothetical protein